MKKYVFLIIFIGKICVFPCFSQKEICKEDFNNNIRNLNEKYERVLKGYYYSLAASAEEDAGLKNLLNAYILDASVSIFKDNLESLAYGTEFNFKNIYLSMKEYCTDFDIWKKKWNFNISTTSKIDDKHMYLYKDEIQAFKVEVNVKPYSNTTNNFILDFYFAKNQSDYKICAILKHDEPSPIKYGITNGRIKGDDECGARIVLDKEYGSFNKVTLYGSLVGLQNPPKRITLKSQQVSYDNVNINNTSFKIARTLSPYSYYEFKGIYGNIPSDVVWIETKGSKGQFVASLIGTTVCIGLGSYASITSNDYNNKYQNAGVPADAEKYRNQTKSWDTVRNVSFSVSVVPLYFLITSFCKKDPIQKLFK